MTKNYYAVVPSGGRIKIDPDKTTTHKVGDIIILDDGLSYDVMWYVTEIKKLSDKGTTEFVLDRCNMFDIGLSKHTYSSYLEYESLKNLMTKYLNYLISSTDWVLKNHSMGDYYYHVTDEDYGDINTSYFTVNYSQKYFLKSNLKEIALKVSICTGLSAEHIDDNY